MISLIHCIQTLFNVDSFMRIGKPKRTQRAVLWAATGVDRQGVSILAQGIELFVRWESGNRTTRKNIGTVDMKLFVDRKIPLGSVMWLGKLADLPDPNSVPAFDGVELFEVIEYQFFPYLKGRDMVQNVLLMRKDAQIPNPA